MVDGEESPSCAIERETSMPLNEVAPRRAPRSGTEKYSDSEDSKTSLLHFAAQSRSGSLCSMARAAARLANVGARTFVFAFTCSGVVSAKEPSSAQASSSSPAPPASMEQASTTAQLHSLEGQGNAQTPEPSRHRVRDEVPAKTGNSRQTVPSLVAIPSASLAAPPARNPVALPTTAKPTQGPEQSNQDEPPSTWHLGGYGELILASQFYHPDPKVNDSTYRDTHLDLARLSLFVGNDLTKRISFSSEIELEHGGTGVAREIEWEEFGEYETEVEKGGEIVLEQAYLEGRPTDWLTLRGGHLLVPVGMTTQYHLPTLFASTHRPESEARLLPSIWHENGVEVMARVSDFTLRGQLLAGLDSTGFSSSHWIAAGTQRAFEKPLVNDVAAVLAVDYLGMPNTVLGASVYTSGSNRNRPKRDLYDVGGRVTIGEVHGRFQHGPFKLRGLVLLGHVQNAAAITRANASLSSNLGASRTPVASAAYAAWIEAAFDILSLFPRVARHRLDLFARYDAYDSMWKAGADFDNPLLQTQAVTSGLNYFPHPRVVIKAECVSRWLNENRDWSRHQSEANAALGFVL